MLVGLERHIENAHEELVVVNELQKLEMLDGAVHLTARFSREQRGQKSVTALYAPFEQRLGVSANERTQIVRCDIHRSGTRRAQSYAYAVVEIEQHFGYVIASVSECKFAVFLNRFFDKLVVGFRQKVLEVKQVL